MTLLPISAIIPTIERRDRLVQTIRSIMTQDVLPSQIVVIDGSRNPWRRSDLAQRLGNASRDGVIFVVESASRCGAGAQRNQGVQLSSQPYIWFLDNDVDLAPGCLSTLWQEMKNDSHLGGCNAIITNQRYSPPGRIMRRLLSWVGCPKSGSLAGLCRGPAMNFLPTDDLRDNGAETEWMNTTCTLYRRAALPDPPFLDYFHGYSLMEDVALSLEVGKPWRLRSVPNALIHHDSVPANYKSRTVARQAMEVSNRWFVARRVMGRPPLQLLYWLLLLQGIGLIALLRSPRQWVSIPGWFCGNGLGFWRIARHDRSWRGYERGPLPSL